MGLISDEQYKYELAREWIGMYVKGSQEWEAALEHLIYVGKNSSDENLREQARLFVARALTKTSK